MEDLLTGIILKVCMSGRVPAWLVAGVDTLPEVLGEGIQYGEVMMDVGVPEVSGLLDSDDDDHGTTNSNQDDIFKDCNRCARKKTEF